MIIGVGIDVVDIGRFGATLERTPALRERLFTPEERDLPLQSLAAQWRVEPMRQGERLLAQGRLRMQGTPQAVRSDPRVLEAYLGGETP